MTSRRFDDAPRAIARLQRRLDDLWKQASRKGHEHGLWQDWTPTLTNITLGNGFQIARYTQIGETVHFYYSLDFGTTTSIGFGQTISLPVECAVPPSSEFQQNTIGTCKLINIGVANFHGNVRIESATTMRPVVHDSSGTYVADAGVAATVPFSWGTDDRLVMVGTYEAA